MDPSSQDDIDLQELAVRIIRYFSRHLRFIFISCGLGIAVGAIAFTSLPHIYQSRMVILSDMLTETYGDGIDLTLSNLLLEKNYAELSVKFQIPEERVTSITSIYVECKADVQNKDRANGLYQTFFTVTVNLKDRSALPEIQEGVLRYFRNNELVKVHTRQREELNTATIKQADKELRSIDSLKKVLFQATQFKTGELMFDPALLFKASIELTQLKMQSQHNLELASSIQLVEGFTALQKPKEPKLLTLSALGFLVGLFGSIGILTLRHLFKLAGS